MSEMDGKIGMRVVVHVAVVGRCQRDTKSYRGICGKLASTKTVNRVTDTRAQRG